MTIEQVCSIEPAIAELMREAGAIRDDRAKPSFCANREWYGVGRLRWRLCSLVGWGGSNPRLRNSEAYDVAYDAVYRLLPDCRKCGCA